MKPVRVLWLIAAILVLAGAAAATVKTAESRAWEDYTTLEPGVSLEEIQTVDATGAPGPAEAARRFVVSIAHGDTHRFEEVTGQPAAEADLDRLRQQLFSMDTTSPVAEVLNLDQIGQEEDALLYHLFVSFKSGEVVGVDVRSAKAREGAYAALSARRRVMTESDRARVTAALEEHAVSELLRY